MKDGQRKPPSPEKPMNCAGREQQRGCEAGEKSVGAKLGQSLPKGKSVFMNLPHG